MDRVLILFAMLALGGVVLVAAVAALCAELVLGRFPRPPVYLDYNDPLELGADETTLP